MSAEISSSELTHSQRRLNTVLAGPESETPRNDLGERMSYANPPEVKVRSKVAAVRECTVYFWLCQHAAVKFGLTYDESAVCC